MIPIPSQPTMAFRKQRHQTSLKVCDGMSVLPLMASLNSFSGKDLAEERVADDTRPELRNTPPGDGAQSPDPDSSRVI
jgi:hypothetical protein